MAEGGKKGKKKLCHPRRHVLLSSSFRSSSLCCPTMYIFFFLFFFSLSTVVWQFANAKKFACARPVAASCSLGVELREGKEGKIWETVGVTRGETHGLRYHLPTIQRRHPYFSVIRYFSLDEGRSARAFTRWQGLV